MSKKLVRQRAAAAASSPVMTSEVNTADDAAFNTPDVPATPPSIDDPLPSTRVVSSVEALSLEERISNLETTLRDYIVNPPKLADAEALGVRIQEAKGMADAALLQVRALSETLPDRMTRIEERAGNIERNLQAVANVHDVPLTVAPHDPEHETAEVSRAFVCPSCGTGFSDIVKAAQLTTQQRPCPTCGRAVDVMASTPVAR